MKLWKLRQFVVFGNFKKRDTKQKFLKKNTVVLQQLLLRQLYRASRGVYVPKMIFLARELWELCLVKVLFLQQNFLTHDLNLKIFLKFIFSPRATITTSGFKSEWMSFHAKHKFCAPRILEVAPICIFTKFLLRWFERKISKKYFFSPTRFFFLPTLEC